MKLISILVTTVACFATSAFAADPYQEIIGWYDNSVAVPMSDLKDTIYEGRCVTWRTPTDIQVASLVVTSKKETDMGPAFPANEIGKAILDGGIRDQTVFKSILDNWDEISAPVLSMNDTVKISQGPYEGEVRRAENSYYVMKLSLIKNNTCTREIKGICAKDEFLPKGTATAACYFFKKLN